MIGEQFRSFFETYFGPLPEADVSGEVCISNPFRHDPNPSLHINLDSGQFNDFGSDLKGDAYGLYIDMHDADYSGAKKAVDDCVAGRPWVKPIDEALIDSWHEELMSNIPIRAYLTKDRGISVQTLKQYKIGYDGERYTIPVRNSYGLAVNVRRYLPTGSGPNKMISYHIQGPDGKAFSGWGMNRLFPLSVLEASDTVIISEGEWDALVTLSRGFSCITATAGAGSWSKSWTDKFQGKTVYLCYDADEPGKKGARKVANILFPVAKAVYIINLPLLGSKDDKDLSDYFVTHGYDASEFQELLDKAKPYVPEVGDIDVRSNVTRTTLAEARTSEYKHKRVEFDVQVIGKDTAPYNIPRRGVYKCSQVGVSERMCGSCGICRAGGELEMELHMSPDVLELIKATKSVQTSFLKGLANIPTGCKMYTFEETQSSNIEEILIAPEIPEFHSWNGQGSEYLVQTAYFAEKQIESNRSYRMQGIMTPDPWQQHVTFVLDKAEPLQDTIETFRITPAIYEQLKIFQTDDVKAKFKEIHDDFEANVTHIVGRDDLLTGIDLVYHSVLGFNFQGIPIQKGWLEFLCIGDTRTGKSETTEAMMRHYQLGEMSVAENTSYAGLVGGLQQTGDKRWFLTWGKLPLNDGRLFVIDEASGLSVDDIAKMSGIRSSGIAEITKIQTERTTARTRLIWLSNPRSGNPMSSYSHGIQAVAELIGKAEDISRFDFVVSAAKDEVPMSLINRMIDEDQLPQHVYTSDLCKQLVLWAWSRKPEDVEFDRDAVQLTLKYASDMGNRYSSQIPLVEGANQRIKLARMAVAVACRVFSTDETGQKVIVQAQHVQFAYDYLNQLYSKPSLNYRGYSAGEYLDAQAAIKNRQHVLAFLEASPGVSEICARQDFIWTRTLEEQLNIDRTAAAELISQLAKWRMITDTGSRGYKKTAGFISILREWENNRMQEALSEEGFDM